LWFDPFVEVLVPGEHDVHPVLDEQRFHLRAQVDFRTVPAAGGIQRVMEVGDLPPIVRGRELILEPLQLLLVHVVAVENEEAGVAFGVGVVAVTVHVERFVEPLRRVVVIAERGVEGNLGVEQRLIRLLELLDEVLRPFGAVDVVADHDHELERKQRSRLGQLLADLELRLRAGAGISDHGKAHRVLAGRRCHRNRTRFGGRDCRRLTGFLYLRCRVRREPC
jgi:hypothetical protein